MDIANREITTHKTNGCNENIEILALGPPGCGGAGRDYFIDFTCDPGVEPGITGMSPGVIRFQNGPIKEAGINGITNEALLAIVIDRLQGFQSGKFACRENALALTKLEEAMHWLQHRTRQRVARGVEGTLEK